MITSANVNKFSYVTYCIKSPPARAKGVTAYRNGSATRALYLPRLALSTLYKKIDLQVFLKAHKLYAVNAVKHTWHG